MKKTMLCRARFCLLVDFRVLPGMTEPQTRKLVQDALDAHGIVGFELN